MTRGKCCFVGGFAIHQTKTENVHMLMMGNKEEDKEFALQAIMALSPESEATHAMSGHDWTE